MGIAARKYHIHGLRDRIKECNDVLKGEEMKIEGHIHLIQDDEIVFARSCCNSCFSKGIFRRRPMFIERQGIAEDPHKPKSAFFKMDRLAGRSGDTRENIVLPARVTGAFDELDHEDPLSLPQSTDRLAYGSGRLSFSITGEDHEHGVSFIVPPMQEYSMRSGGV